MSKSYQEIGLTQDAKDFLAENCEKIPKTVCPKCGEVVTTREHAEVYEQRDSFYGDGPWLQNYYLKDGTTVKEVVQCEPWSSGPCAFFCLEKEDGTKMFLWSVEEIKEIL